VPLFMDVHTVTDGVTKDDVAKAHQAGLAHQGEHGVNYLRYWVDEGHGQIFCLVEAPDADAATAVHRETHGLVADAIYQVQEAIYQVQEAIYQVQEGV
jgi:hypothetical protein